MGDEADARSGLCCGERSPETNRRLALVVGALFSLTDSIWNGTVLVSRSHSTLLVGFQRPGGGDGDAPRSDGSHSPRRSPSSLLSRGLTMMSASSKASAASCHFLLRSQWAGPQTFVGEAESSRLAESSYLSRSVRKITAAERSDARTHVEFRSKFRRQPPRRDVRELMYAFLRTFPRCPIGSCSRGGRRRLGGKQ